MFAETKFRTKDLAKKLKKVLATEQQVREHQKKVYANDLEIWRRSMTQWFRENSAPRVLELTIARMRDVGRYGHVSRAFGETFFRDAPKPPVYPSNERIRDLQRMIKTCEVATESVIQLSTSDVERYFGGVEPKEGY